MLSISRLYLPLVFTGLACLSAAAQPPAAPPAPPPPPPASAVAATVNGKAIPELAVYRALLGVPPDKHAEARAEIIKHLGDNILLDQYLETLKISVEKKEVD